MVSVSKLTVLLLIPIFLFCKLDAKEVNISKTKIDIIIIDTVEIDKDLIINNDQLSSDEWEEYKRIKKAKKKNALEPSPYLFPDNTENIYKTREDIYRDRKEKEKLCERNRLDAEKVGKQFSDQDYELCLISSKQEWQK